MPAAAGNTRYGDMHSTFVCVKCVLTVAKAFIQFSPHDAIYAHGQHLIIISHLDVVI